MQPRRFFKFSVLTLAMAAGSMPMLSMASGSVLILRIRLHVESGCSTRPMKESKGSDLHLVSGVWCLVSGDRVQWPIPLHAGRTYGKGSL